MFTRRGFLRFSLASSAAVLLAGQSEAVQRVMAAARASTLALQSPQVPLAGSAIPQFVDALPELDVIPGNGGPLELQMTEFQTNVLPANTVPGYTGTWVWGYLKPGQAQRASYLGPVIVATRGQPTEIKFVNNLGNAATTNVLAYRYGTDQTLHWADPLNHEANMWNHMAMPPAVGSEGAENYLGAIPAVVHLHGGEVPPVLDGGPDAWVTSDGQSKGHGFYSKDGEEATNYHIYRYPNTQESAPIWFHDHTLGATRLNVYCGLAGGYLVTDPANDPQNMPPLIPLAIQDRMFDTNGQLFLPSGSAGGLQWAPNPEHPYWVPEFLGDVICVNGKAWPYLNVQAQRYLFLAVNGSNARAYEMFLIDPVSGNLGPALWVVSTDGGYLDKPVQVGGVGSGYNNKLVMLPGERYMFIIDFANFQAGVIGPNGKPYSGNWLLRNTAKSPYPAGAAVNGGTTGKIMLFKVQGGAVTDTSFNPAVKGATVRKTPLPRLVNPATGAISSAYQKTRQLTLNEVMGMPQTATNPVTGALTAYPGGPLEILVNNTKWNGKRIVGVDTTDPMMPMYKMEPIPDFVPDRDPAAHPEHFVNYLSEVPQEGETEIWEFVNLTADAHPMHTHLVQFQLINRQNFDTAKYGAAYAAAFPGGGWDPMVNAQYLPGVYIPSFGPPLSNDPSKNNLSGGKWGGNPDIAAKDAKGRPLFLKGTPTPPLPQEAGWKDTVVAFPGQVTRIAVRWAPTELPANTPPADAFFPFDPAAGGGGYVWHCHIVDHEDNEMMRPDQVKPNPKATRTFVYGKDY